MPFAWRQACVPYRRITAVTAQIGYDSLRIRTHERPLDRAGRRGACGTNRRAKCSELHSPFRHCLPHCHETDAIAGVPPRQGFSSGKWRVARKENCPQIRLRQGGQFPICGHLRHLRAVPSSRAKSGAQCREFEEMTSQRSPGMRESGVSAAFTWQEVAQ
jgi:hypothetical protein